MNIETAFKRLLIKDPFYGLFALGLPKRETRMIPTLAVGRKGIYTEMRINPDYWNMHTDDEQIALLKHELGHICFQHMFLADSFADRKTFNLAADLEVNSYIDNLPKTGYFAKDFGLNSGLGSKRYYEFLTQQHQSHSYNPAQPPQNSDQSEDEEEDENRNNQQQQQQEQEQEEQQEQQDQQQEQQDNKSEEEKRQEEEDKEREEQFPDYLPQDKDPVGSHSSWKEFQELPDATQQLIQNNIETLVQATAEQVERQCGNIPGEFKELVEKLREKKPEIFNWKAYFRRILGTIYDINIKSTRRRESKRFEGAAGIKHKKKVSILVAVDTSGSVATKELQEFFNEIDYIYKAGARITVIECDTQINKMVEYDGKNIPEIKGRGGTSFNPPIEYYIKHRKEYASLIYFTDGYCSLPDKRPSEVVWIITSNGSHQEYPGKVIYIPKETNNGN